MVDSRDLVQSMHSTKNQGAAAPSGKRKTPTHSREVAGGKLDRAHNVGVLQGRPQGSLQLLPGCRVGHVAGLMFHDLCLRGNKITNSLAEGFAAAACSTT